MEAEDILGCVVMPAEGTGAMAALAGYGTAEVELMFGREGVGSAEVLITVVLGEAPAVVVRAPTHELLLFCNALEGGGVGAAGLTLVGGCVNV